MENEQLKVYKHSGKVGLMGFGPIFMVVLGALSLSLSIVYVLAIYLIPWVYANFLITACFGVICGYAVGIGGKIGKVRNAPLYVLIGLAIGVTAVYCQWVVWIFVHSMREELILEPSGILNYMSDVAVDGFWSIFRIPIKGKFLYAVWVIEGLMISVCSAGAAYGVLCSSPFCEDCGRWFGKKGNICIMPLEAIEEPERIRQELLAGDCSTLLNLNIKDSFGDAYTKLEISNCPSCFKFCLLSVISVTIQDSEDSEEEFEDPVIAYLMITDPMFQRIMARYFPQPGVESQFDRSRLQAVHS